MYSFTLQLLSKISAAFRWCLACDRVLNQSQTTSRFILPVFNVRSTYCTITTIKMPLPLCIQTQTHIIHTCTHMHSFSLSLSHSIFHLINLYYAVSSSFRNRQWSGTESVYSGVPMSLRPIYHFFSLGKHVHSIFSFIAKCI